ncbi:TPA: LuxR C-terminal-related transcriptional regulator [Pluralibacter gergoviae]
MMVFSSNYYFINGLCYLLEEDEVDAFADYVVFDVGEEQIFVIHQRVGKYLCTLDPLVAFAVCRHTAISKKESLGYFFSELEKRSLTKTFSRNFLNLSTIEIYVLRQLCNQVSNEKVAMQLNVHEKTVGGYKISAIRKMKMRNISSFFAAFFSWLPLWHQYKQVMGSEVPHAKQTSIDRCF